VIFGEAVDHPVDCDQPRRSEDPGLVEGRAPKTLQVHSSRGDRGALTGQDRPDGRAETLVQAQRDRVYRCGQRRERNAEGDGGVREPRAVEVGPRGGRRKRCGLLDLEDGAAVSRVRVLEADHVGRARLVEPDGGQARDPGQPVALVHEDVRPRGERRPPAGPGER